MLLEAFEIDLEDPDFKETPARVGRMYEEIFSGLNRKDEIEDMLKKWFPTT